MTAVGLPLSNTRESAADAAEVCARILAQHSKSFALAGRLLPPQQRRDAAVLYTYCRLADDRIDLVPKGAQALALDQLRHSLAAIYRGQPEADLRLRAFQELARRRDLPREYPQQLLAGMAMDVAEIRYETLPELLLYCHRVAGVVGLMMCRVLGVSDAGAERNAAHLGIAMQLTNICRDVAEDWSRGRLYLPRAMLRACGGEDFDALAEGELSPDARHAMAKVSAELLAEAERFYRSGERGIRFLPFRAAFSVRAARLIYAAIGRHVRRRGCDPLAPRAVVPILEKLVLLAKAALQSALELPSRWREPQRRVALGRVMRYPDDILPL